MIGVDEQRGRGIFLEQALMHLRGQCRLGQGRCARGMATDGSARVSEARLWLTLGRPSRVLTVRLW